MEQQVGVTVTRRGWRSSHHLDVGHQMRREAGKRILAGSCCITDDTKI
jgi:hypothetical protein